MSRTETVTVYGFPVSTYVNIVRLVLSEKGVPFTFVDLEPRMGTPSHLALHPFNRVPILDHDGFVLYETAAIVSYIDETFDGPRLQPDDVRERARMNQWIGSLNSYYYPYMAFHLGHERLVYPNLGIAPDEKVVAVALPKIANGLDVMERALEHGRKYLIAERPTLADFFMLPTMTTLSLTPEGQSMLSQKPRIGAWRAAMEALPSVIAVRIMVAPHIGKPVEHARNWIVDHRPKY
ncbi:MAG: glutathione S-transferase family protein [Proteobacteria bacterium]|nr:glutathione S-transferase family protein [Pseudomonadota bacterium]